MIKRCDEDLQWNLGMKTEVDILKGHFVWERNLCRKLVWKLTKILRERIGINSVRIVRRSFRKSAKEGNVCIAPLTATIVAVNRRIGRHGVFRGSATVRCDEG